MTESIDYFRNLPDGPEKQPFLQFLGSFDEPETVADEIRRLMEADDPYVAPEEVFFQRPGEQLFENWDYPVNARTFHQEDEGRLLCLPPGSDRFDDYRQVMPTVMERQLEVNFPRLKSELANRPNLLFPGVFYPDEIHIRNMEMISLNHGRNYVVRADLELEGSDQLHTVVLKPASMGVEAVITSTLHELNRRMPAEIEQDVGPIRVPSVVSVDDTYGIVEFIPGQNGVETLPDGINTGTIHTLKSNEYPEDFEITEQGLLELADEFAKQAACAFYLRLYDRKPDQLVFNRRESGGFRVTHIDFGRAIKRNFALPWKRYYATQRAPLVFEDHQIPYFEAAASLIFLPHFIPERLEGKLDPFHGKLRDRMKNSFVKLGEFFQKNVEVIEEHFQYLVGERTQFDTNEVHGLSINERDVEEVHHSLLSLEPSPGAVFDSVINLAYHEHSGSTPTESESDGEDDTIYRRMARPGGESRKLAERADGDHSYEMKPYDDGGAVYYDRDRRCLNIEFGSKPERVIEHVRERYSPRLAEFIEQWPDIQPGVEVTVYLDGRSTVRIPPGMTRNDIDFPQQAIQQFRQVVSGFAPTHHVRQYIDNYLEWKQNNPEADFIQEETRKQTIAFANNLEGKEVLQSYQLPGEEAESIHKALSEVIRHMLSNPDYLADKDPIKSVNQLIISLGQKYELVDPLGEHDLNDDGLDSYLTTWFDLYNHDVPTEHFADKTPHHVIHVRSMLKLARFFSDELDLSDDRRRMLITASVLHDLNVLDAEFAQLLSDPNGRLNRPIFEDYLASHTDITVRIFSELDEDAVPLPKGVDRQRLEKVLKHHHEATQSDDTVAQLLHLIDNLAVFSDHTRPDHWNRGYLRFRDLAPQWIRAQSERDRINQPVHEAAQKLFEEENEPLLEEIDYQSHDFPELYNALHMGAALHHGLDPQNPGLLDDLRDRHGEETVDGIWSRVLRSYLPVGEKIRVIRRLDELAPLFSREDVGDYAFINASPRPIQLAVELIRHHLEKDRKVVLMGLFPRVTKAYRRFLEQHGDSMADRREEIVAISGHRRLQFIRHSYPFEADFERPFHQIIQEHRQTHDKTENLTFIPFQAFHEHYAPTKEATTRIRKLEKVSELEEQHVPERVETEAQRYRIWKNQQEPYAVDTLENERFRRILLNNFTNREVLYFYQRTIDDRPDVQVALKEVIGALRENPNYLSERDSRYSLHELVRSLSQIHFFSGDRPRAYDHLEEVLTEQGIEDTAPYFQLLDRYGEELNFFKNTLGTGLQVMSVLSRDFDDLPTEAMIFTLLGCGIMCEEEGLRDYLLSPEDISYNRAVRRRLVSHTVKIAERLFDTEAFSRLPDDVREEVRGLMTEARPPRAYGVTQSSLFLAMYLDYGRVENWERGRRRITSQDIDSILSPLETMMPRHVPDRVTDQVLDSVQNAVEREGIDQFNRFSRPTYSYIYLFNALSLARDLRYGLFPEGHSPFENTRLLYGVDRTNRLIQGMVQSDLSAPESVKICRKIRSLASGLQRHDREPSKIFFLNLDRIGSWQLPDLEEVEEPMMVLTGEFLNCLKFWEELRETNPGAIPYCHTLIGEEFPVLMKETSLSYTDFFEERITQYRRKNKLVGRHLMMPAKALFEDPPQRPDPVVMSYHNLPPGLYINAWLALFDL